MQKSFAAPWAGVVDVVVLHAPSCAGWPKMAPPSSRAKKYTVAKRVTTPAQYSSLKRVTIAFILVL